MKEWQFWMLMGAVNEINRYLQPSLAGTIFAWMCVILIALIWLNDGLDWLNERLKKKLEDEQARGL